MIDLDTLDGSEGDWLIGEPGLVGPGDEVDWLRSDLEDSPVVSVKKKSLVNKLDDLSRGKSNNLTMSVGLTLVATDSSDWS